MLLVVPYLASNALFFGGTYPYLWLDENELYRDVTLGAFSSVACPAFMGYNVLFGLDCQLLSLDAYSLGNLPMRYLAMALFLGSALPAPLRLYSGAVHQFATNWYWYCDALMLLTARRLRGFVFTAGCARSGYCRYAMCDYHCLYPSSLRYPTSARNRSRTLMLRFIARNKRAIR